jgi:hypothetical protein
VSIAQAALGRGTGQRAGNCPTDDIGRTHAVVKHNALLDACHCLSSGHPFREGPLPTVAAASSSPSRASCSKAIHEGHGER